MNLIKTGALFLIVLLVACGGGEKEAVTSNATSMAEKAVKKVSEGSSQLKEMKKDMTESATAMKDKGMDAGAALKDKMTESVPTIKDAVEAPKEMAKKAKDAVSVSINDAKAKGKKTMDAVKEKVQTTASTASEKVENVAIKGAKKITETTKSTAPTTPKIVEQPREAVATKAAAAATTVAAAATTAAAATKAAVKEKVKPKSSTVDHGPWDQLLRKHVTSAGKVNYGAIKANSSSFDAYLKTLSDNPIKNEWSRNEKMAYWINAYNAYTIKLIVDNYPVKSITDLHGGKPWDHSWIKLGSKTYTLNDIEHKILRPQFKDPRIHFAVNCAATSCPPVLNRAWTAGNLNKNLEKQTKQFINDSSFNSLSGDVAVSKIFDWYKEDFGELSAYLNKYANSPIAAGANIGFKEYDWALNKQ